MFKEVQSWLQSYSPKLVIYVSQWWNILKYLFSMRFFLSSPPSTSKKSLWSSSLSLPLEVICQNGCLILGLCMLENSLGASCSHSGSQDIFGFWEELSC